MKKLLENLPEKLKDLIYQAKALGEENNLPVYLVGGFVRDLFLGVENLDLDIVVEGDGIKFAQDLASKLKAKIIRHKQFGTATLILEPQTKIDIATSRKEYYPEPAHLPVVSPGRLKDDLFRRDFTINAMAIDIGKNFGELIDLFGGKRDLEQKKIRIMHVLSFQDDPTRILRAVRFEKRYNFKIEPLTLRCLKEAVKKKMLEVIQAQRLRDELILILKEKYPLKPIMRLKELTGFKFLHPHLNITKKTYGLLKSIEKEINWFKKNYPQRRTLDSWLIYLMGLLDALSIEDTEIVCKRFVFRRGEEKRILSYKNIKKSFIKELSSNKIKPKKIFCLLEPLSYEVIILLKAKYKNLNLQRNIQDYFEIYNGMKIYISGKDLRKLGVLPGPYYQKIFTKTLEAKLNGKIKTKEQELMFIKKIILKK